MSHTWDPSNAQQNEMSLAYGLSGAVNTIEGYAGQHVTEYNPTRMSTLMLFCTCTGTVLRHRILWAEQLIILILYALVAAAAHKVRHEHDAVATETLGSFVEKMATLAAFLLSFYTSLTVARWWRLRTDGIGSICSASSQLSLFISQMVTRDPQVLSAIRRYARASLAMTFMKRRYAAKFPEKLDDLVRQGILTHEEVDKLRIWNSNLAESIWTWITHIVVKLHDQGLIKSDLLFISLLDKVNSGRAGCALIGAQMATPIPLPYVHLLGFLVKLHNLTIALALGYLVGVDWSSEQIGFRWMMTGKVFFVPLLYNALLLINSELADPFDGDINDFPLKKQEQGMESDSQSYIDAGAFLPAWLEEAGHKAV